MIVTIVLVAGALMYERQNDVAGGPSFFRTLKALLNLPQLTGDALSRAAGVGSGRATPRTLVAATKTSLRASIMSTLKGRL